VENLYSFALVPDLVIYMDIDVPHLIPRVLRSTGFDYWESGQDYLPNPNLYDNFVTYQTNLLAELRRQATRHRFEVVDARQSVPDVFRVLCTLIEGVIRGMGSDSSNGLRMGSSVSR
jgi:dTMP kinase